MLLAGYTPGQRISATYWTSVYMPNLNGWRTAMVFAELEVISPARARVVSASFVKAKSKRQKFNPKYAAANEIGAVKLIGKLDSVKVIG